jgi:signal transduction histidine kinase
LDIGCGGWRFVLVFLVGALCGSLALAQTNTRTPDAETISVLVLLSGSADNSLENDFLAGFSARLRQVDGPVVSLHVEFLDLMRAGDRKAALADWKDRLTRKYRDIPLDAVVTHRRDALSLVLDSSLLAGGAVLVHAGLSRAELASFALPTGAVGAPASWDIAGTVRLARTLFPEARHVAIVAGKTPREAELVAEAEAAVQVLEPTAGVIDLRGLDWPRMQDKLATLPPDTVILAISMALDAQGRVVDQMQALKRGAEIANAPAFTLSPVSLGMGTVGGSILDLRAVGTDAAQRVLAALARDPAAMAAALPFVGVRLDARALARWGVADRLVPQGAEILFQPPSLWRDFRGQVVAGGIAMVCLSGLALGLGLERRQRRLAETAAKSRLAQIARMNRASSMGQLSASIAHEVNQPLGAVLNYAEGAHRLLAVTPLPLDKLKQALTAIRAESQRASDRIARVRSLFTASETPFSPIDLNGVVTETVTLARAEAERRKIALDLALQPGPLTVLGDAVQLQQAVLNLILNALDACSDRTDGSLKVAVSATGKIVTVQVTDNGKGIDPAMAKHLFEAFHTTKADGMGVGLAIVRSILDAHGGTISIQSPKSGGTCMQMTLPLVDHASGDRA